MLGTVLVGKAPLPIWLSQSITSILATPERRCVIARVVRSARPASSSSGRASRRNVGIRSTSRSGSRYSRRTADRAASVTLSQRNARFIGLRLMRAIRSPRPTMMPACGPPSSLSPLKVTMSAPAASVSRGVGSCGNPKRLRSVRAPLPRSTTNGTSRSWQRAARSDSLTAAVKPCISKLLG